MKKIKLLCVFLAFSSTLFSQNNCVNHDWAIQTINNTNSLSTIVPYASFSDAAGNIILAGSYAGNFQFVAVGENEPLSGNSFVQEMFVASLNQNGNLNWINTTVSNGYQTLTNPSDVTIDDQGNVYVIGKYRNRSGINSPLLFQGTNNTSVSIPYSASNNYNETFIVKYSSNGSIQWVTNPLAVGSVPSSKGVEGISIDITNGNLIAMHDFTHDVNVNGNLITSNSLQKNTLITKVNPTNGSYVWAKTIQTSNNTDYAKSSEIKIGDNNIYISGSYQGAIDFNGNLYQNTAHCGYISKLDLSGNIDWFKTIEDGPVNTIELSNTCKTLYAVGLYSGIGGIIIDGHHQPSIGQSQGHNIYLTSIDESGVADWVSPLHGFLATHWGSTDHLELDEYDNLYVNALAVDLGSSSILDVFSGSVQLNANFSPNTQFSFTAKFLKNGDPVRINAEENIFTTTFDKVTNRYFMAGTFYGNIQFGTNQLIGNPLYPDIYLTPARQTPFAGVTSPCLKACPEEPIALEAFDLYNHAISFHWSPNDFLDNDNLSSVNFSSNIIGEHNYVVSIEDNAGCIDKAHVEVEVLSNIPPQIEVPTTQICVNSPSFFVSVPDPTLGSWSASCGSCIDPNTGEFFPNIAEVGTHEIFFNTPCATAEKSIEVSPDYVCCMEDLEEPIVLKGHYTQPDLPSIADGSTVIIEDNVTLENINLNWNNVKVFIEGRNQGMTVTGYKLELVNTRAVFENCTFQSTCENMWKGIEVRQKSEIHMLQETQVSDAYKGIEILDNTIREIILRNSSFTNNLYSIYFKTGEFPFQTQITGCTFNSDIDEMKIPFDNKGVNDNYYSEAHLYFENGMSRGFPFTFNGNKIENCKYGLYSEDNFDFGLLMFNCQFTNCFAAAIHSVRILAQWGSGNGMVNNLTVNESVFNFPVNIPLTNQFSGISQTLGIRHNNGDLEVNDCYFYGTKEAFSVDIGIEFYNPVYKLYIKNCEFNDLSIAIQLRAFGGHWLKKLEDNSSQVLHGGTEITIISNYFIDSDEGIRFMSNNNPNGINPPAVILPGIPTGLTNPLPCPTQSCPEVDIHQVKQTIRCNEFIRTDGLVSTAIYVEPNTLMQHIGALSFPAGNEIIDNSNSMRSVWNLGSSFKYAHYSNENLSPLSPYIFNAVTFVNSNILADPSTCPGDAGTRKSRTTDIQEPKNFINDAQSVSIYPNPSATGVFILKTEGFNENKTVYVLDVFGKTITEFSSVDQRTISLDLSNYAKGMYYVNVVDSNNKRSIRKVIFE